MEERGRPAGYSAIKRGASMTASFKVLLKPVNVTAPAPMFRLTAPASLGHRKCGEQSPERNLDSYLSKIIKN